MIYTGRGTIMADVIRTSSGHDVRVKFNHFQDTGETLYRIIIQKEGIFLNSGLFSQVCINHLVSDFPFDLLVAMVEVMVEWVKSSKQLQNNNLPWMTGN